MLCILNLKKVIFVKDVRVINCLFLKIGVKTVLFVQNRIDSPCHELSKMVLKFSVLLLFVEINFITRSNYKILGNPPKWEKIPKSWVFFKWEFASKEK